MPEKELWINQRMELCLVPHGDPEAISSVVLNQPFARVGRLGHYDLVLDQEDVSRQHVYLHKTGEEVFFVDLGSRTGCRFAGVPKSSGWLSPFQPLEIGSYQIYVETESAEVPTSLLTPVTGYDRIKELWITVLGENGRWEVFHPRCPLTLIGSRPPSTILLEDFGLHPVHLAVYLERETAWLINLSHSKMKRHGETSSAVQLSANFSMHLPRCEMRFEFEPPQAPSSSRTKKGTVGVEFESSSPESTALFIPGNGIAPPDSDEIRKSKLATEAAPQEEDVLAELLREELAREKQRTDRLRQKSRKIYETLKRERDQLRTEVARLNERVAMLVEENKEWKGLAKERLSSVAEKPSVPKLPPAPVADVSDLHRAAGSVELAARTASSPKLEETEEMEFDLTSTSTRRGKPVVSKSLNPDDTMIAAGPPLARASSEPTEEIRQLPVMKGRSAESHLDVTQKLIHKARETQADDMRRNFWLWGGLLLAGAVIGQVLFLTLQSLLR